MKQDEQPMQDARAGQNDPVNRHNARPIAIYKHLGFRPKGAFAPIDDFNDTD